MRHEERVKSTKYTKNGNKERERGGWNRAKSKKYSMYKRKLKTRNTKQSIRNWRVSKKCKYRKSEQEKQNKIARKMGL